MQFFNTAVPDGSITTAKLADLAVTAAKIAALAVTNDKLAGPRVNVQVFTASGTYTPSTNISGALVFVEGGGGGGGGAAIAGSGYRYNAVGGSAGGWALGYFSSATLGAAQSVTVGAAGSAGVGAIGGNGGDSSFGSLISATGGEGGGIAGPSNVYAATLPSFAGYGTGGFINAYGGVAGVAVGNADTPYQISNGADAVLGGGGAGSVNSSSSNASGYGAGGGGASSAHDTVVLTGGQGAPGLIIVVELY